MKIQYCANNSGGVWWLKDEDWKALEAAGWDVEWRKKRWLGALATRASKEFESIKDALLEFERITKEDVTDEGHGDDGAPHRFEWDDDVFAGYGCMRVLYDIVPGSFREAVEMLNAIPTVGK